MFVGAVAQTCRGECASQESGSVDFINSSPRLATTRHEQFECEWSGEIPDWTEVIKEKQRYLSTLVVADSRGPALRG